VESLWQAPPRSSAAQSGLALRGHRTFASGFSPSRRSPAPSLDALEVYALDGKKIKHVAKRLKALWRLNGQVWGGKLVVVQYSATGLAVALAAHADGEADERPLVATALAQVRQQGGDKPRLWIGDRLFCDRKQLPSLQEGGDPYLVRHHSRFHSHPDPARPAQTGVDGRGVPCTQEWGWLGAEGQGQRPQVRRITLQRRAAPALAVVTDLLDEATYPAADLLEAYLRRWTIETTHPNSISRQRWCGHSPACYHPYLGVA
jgi:hypothetical protein